MPPTSMLSVYLEYLIQLVKPLPPINSSHVAGPCNQIVNLNIGPKKKPLTSFINHMPGAIKPVFEAITLENLSGSSAITLKPTNPPQS